MRANNSQHVIAAARRRSQATRPRAAAALRRMDTAGIPITFKVLAREAGVSRSWLYTQADLRAEVERLRTRQRPSPRVPDRQHATDASLLTRLQIATERIRQLESDNTRLRQALAEALGERRATGRSKPERDTPKRRVSPAIRPC